MKLKYLITVLRTIKISGLLPIMRDWQAFVRMHYLFAALESGLLETLSTPCSRDDLMQKLNAKRPEILDALLDVGLAAGELTFKNGLYSIRGKRSQAIAGSEGDMLAAMIQANVTYYSSAYRNASDRMRGAPLGHDLEQIGSVVARFAKIGEPFIRHFLTDIVSEKNPLKVLDVGCGSGVFLRSIHEINQRVTGIGIDVDESVVDQARQNLVEWGLTDKFKIISGDIRVSPNGFEGPFHLITLFNVLYYFSDEDRHKLLRTLRSMLFPNGMVAIAMNFHSGGRDLGAANLNMVNSAVVGLTGLPDLNETKNQLREAGLNRIKEQRLIPGSTFYGVVAGDA